ncbi:Do/DeqQ family serine protease [Lutimaribacter pacificus]|uniref:Do/DeqQ family serine protease n=1 Tax=Lutimaribacter pacificus TaxID=391948 RepID=A0A1H0KV83_9RHOB|nr:trypsin-like peptidase domain-containing protein [Lutimaribacter pacificus]SDO59867.1 Do/DeqQ family serine protease [Lutimaribacter pacificus]SHK73618.1 Do/DeqQ family serine protease [Lutimaribacter pacificus]
MLRSLLILIVLAVPAWAETPRVPQSPAEITLSFAPLVKRATPAVVNIYARRVVESRVSPFQSDPFFRDLFRDFGQTRPRVQNSLGSGVILSADGLVVSNFHVVGQATDIRVVLADRREYSARVILGDEEADLAVLQVENAQDLPVLPLRDSDSVEVGELVLAIGNPFGVGQTVSSGIVSGLARSGGARGNARGYFIQTDAAINPGNSGGALIDAAGRLIGVNTSILTRSGGSNGIGFAIPANLVAEFVRQAQAGAERFEKPWAGVSGQPVDADIAASLGLPVPEGIVISALHPASPFLTAGFAPGDIITAVDGEPVNSAPEMVFRMAVAGLGGKAQVTRLRDGQEETVTVAMIAAPDDPPRDQRALGEGTVLPGLVVSNLNPAVIAEYGLPLGADGVLVDEPGPYGARIGLRPGDIIRAVNGDEIASTADADRALSADMRALSLDVQRGLQRIVMRARL